MGYRQNSRDYSSEVSCVTFSKFITSLCLSLPENKHNINSQLMGCWEG